MGKALLQLLPLALASALSTVTISATIFFLLSKTRTRSGLAFLTGTVIGTFAAVTLATVAGQALPGRPRHHHEVVGKLELVTGIALVVLGLVSLARRHRVVNSARRPGWLHGISDVGPVPVFGIGLALNLRPKAVLLAAAAGLVVSDANLAFDENLVLLLLYTVVATVHRGSPRGGDDPLRTPDGAASRLGERLDECPLESHQRDDHDRGRRLRGRPRPDGLRPAIAHDLAGGVTSPWSAHRPRRSRTR